MARESGGGVFVDISLTGDKELQNILKELPIKLQKKLVKRSMKKAMNIVLVDAKRRAPKDSGQLKGSLKNQAGRGKKGTIRQEVRTKEGFFKGDQFYAGFIEFGFKKLPAVRLPNGQLITSKRGTAGFTKIPARPFLRPALKENEAKVLKVFIKEVEAFIVDAQKD